MCDKKYKVKVDLRRHKLYHQQQKDKPYKCPLCESRAATKTHIRSHLIFAHKLSKEEATTTLTEVKKFTSESDNVEQSVN